MLFDTNICETKPIRFKDIRLLNTDSISESEGNLISNSTIDSEIFPTSIF